MVSQLWFHYPTKIQLSKINCQKSLAPSRSPTPNLQLPHLSPTKSPCSNPTPPYYPISLPLLDMAAFHQLCNNKNVTVGYRDKNLGPILLNPLWEPREAKRHLSNQDVFKSTTPTEIDAQLKILSDFISQNKTLFTKLGPSPLSDKEYDGLKSKTIDAILMQSFPNLKLLAKTHKFKVLEDDLLLKGRPLIGAFNCATTFLSHFVDTQLSNFSHLLTNVLIDSKTLVKDLLSLKLPPGAVIATADVQELYPSIPIQEGCDAVEKFLLFHANVSRDYASFIKQALFFS